MIVIHIWCNDMIGQLQKGIYFRRKPRIGNSLALLYLRARDNVDAQKVGVILGKVWEMCNKLKGGITSDDSISLKHFPSGNLSVLIGYGPKIFALDSAHRSRPDSFNEKWLFVCPTTKSSILEGSRLSYGTGGAENHSISDHIVIQFVADHEFYTNRAVIETWKMLHRLQKNSSAADLYMTSFYTGFQRLDKRNWLGFHDGVSNIESIERRHAISISVADPNSRDKWLENGTYLAFLRIYVDLQKWEDIDTNKQEILIGRHKPTGCPIIGVDKTGKPYKDSSCPVTGTFDVMDRGNERFRNHPDFGHQTNLSRNLSDQLLKNSHIAQTRLIDRVPVSNKNSSRIFRQGFEFLERHDQYPHFRVGLNFISFQNSPERIFKTLMYKPVTPVINIKGKVPALESYFTVQAAAIFLVPPEEHGEPFPGASIFFNNKQLSSNYAKLTNFRKSNFRLDKKF